MAKYRKNEFLREPLSIKEFKPLEKEYRPKIAKAFNKQLNKVVTKTLIADLIQYAKSRNLIKKVSKELTPEEIDFQNYVTSQVAERSSLQDDSNESNEISELLLLLIISGVETGLKVDKISFLNRTKALNVEELKPIIENTSLSIKLTNTQVLDYLDNYSLQLTSGLNNTQKERISNFLVREVISGKSVDEISKNLSVVEKINERRSYTTVRTELMNAKAFENRYWLERRGFQIWEWYCNKPQDYACLINCGVRRPIGSPFPSGNTMAGVHPNCQCRTDGVIPNKSDLIEFGLWTAAILAGIDWTGE